LKIFKQLLTFFDKNEGEKVLCLQTSMSTMKVKKNLINSQTGDLLVHHQGINHNNQGIRDFKALHQGRKSLKR